MTATASTRMRLDRGVLVDLAWRAALVVVATVAILVGLPAWGRAPLAIAAALATAMFFLRRYRRRGLLDAVLTAVGGSVVVLVLLGLLLNVLPSGLSAASWGIGVGVLELVALVALAYWRAPLAGGVLGGRRIPVAAIVWGALIAAVLAGALVWSAASFTATHVAPLAVSAETSGSSVVITVSSGTAKGPYELDLVTAKGRTVLAAGIAVGPDASSTTTVTLPKKTRDRVELVTAGSTTAIRTLIIDTTKATK